MCKGVILWDKKREEDGYGPDDDMFSKFKSDNYNCYHYVIEHPVVIGRKDNYLRCVGLMMSNNEYVTQIDDDCWLEDDWLNRAANNITNYNVNYCFCLRRMWEDENTIIGIDAYESIGVTNELGYNLMETNSIVFRKTIVDKICSITYLNNDYGHDRELGKYLINIEQGYRDDNFGLNQISPECLLEFHRKTTIKE